MQARLQALLEEEATLDDLTQHYGQAVGCLRLLQAIGANPNPNPNPNSSPNPNRDLNLTQTLGLTLARTLTLQAIGAHEAGHQHMMAQLGRLAGKG